MQLDELIRSVTELADRVGSSNDFELAGKLGHGYVGRSQGGSPVVLVPIRWSEPSAGRRTGAMRLTPSPAVRFSYSGSEWTEPAAVIECLDPALTTPFFALASDLSSRIPEEHADWDALVDVFDEWQRLLSRRGKLGTEKEVGLWGELRFILDSPDPDALLDCWRGPSTANVDFQGLVNVEVKTSMREHAHEISLDQVEALCSTAGYLVSIWIEQDPAGDTLPELFERVTKCVRRPDRLIREAMRIGYSSSDGSSYSARYQLREAPYWYAGSAVPRVRDVDAGVLNVRFRARLPTEDRLSVEQCTAIWATWCPRGKR